MARGTTPPGLASHLTMSNPSIIPLFVLLNLVLFGFTAAVGAPQAHCFFIFGDSLVDNGNNNYLNTTAKVNYLPYGIDFPAGPTGRFSNGRNIADVLVQMFGLETLPPFANSTDMDALVGLNYGSGGSGILDDTGSNYGDVISMNEQVSNHEAVVAKIVAGIGSVVLSMTHLNKCIYYVGIGNNDYIGNYLPKYYFRHTPYTPEQFAEITIKQFAKQLRRLYKSGARRVPVIALGQIGCIPQQMIMFGSDSASCLETSNKAAQIFNEKLQILINGLNKQLPDAQFLYVAPGPDNAALDGIKVVNEPCCVVSAETQGHCVEGSEMCSNRDEYYFWDWYHPTEAAVLATADSQYKAIAPLVPPLVDVL